jgi:hypothetical protein
MLDVPAKIPQVAPQEQGDAQALRFAITFNDGFSTEAYLDAFIEKLTSGTIQRNALQDRPSTRNRLQLGFRILLANLLRAVSISPRCYLAISMRKPEYVGSKIGYSSVKQGVSYLSECGLTDYHRGFQDRGRGKRFTTRIRATEALTTKVHGEHHKAVQGGNPREEPGGILRDIRGAC